MRRFLRRHWFLAGIVVAVALGFIAPSGGRAIRDSGVVLPLLVATTLAISGFTLDASRLRTQAVNFRAILLTLATTYAVAPLAAWTLAVLCGPSLDTEQGVWFVEAVMISAAQAGTLASALALTVVARGDQELALVLTVLSNALTVVATPLVLELSVGREVAFSGLEMAGRMALVVLLPVVVGQIARRFLFDLIAPALDVIRGIPRFIILSFLYTGTSAAAGELGLEQPRIILGFLVVVTALHALLIAWTWSLSRVLGLSRPARTAVVFCGSQKTLPNGLYIWAQFFGANPYGAVPLVLYHVLQLFVDTLLVPRLAARRVEED